ncbi:MAG: Dabb family protein [Syntrophobacteraceae bacterium]
MLRHVVLFKFKKDIDESAVAAMEKSLGALPAAIPEIKEYVFGRDFVHSERSCDFALVSSFENLDALKRYQVHPKHQAVLARLKEICDSILVVDFRF